MTAVCDLFEYVKAAIADGKNWKLDLVENYSMIIDTQKYKNRPNESLHLLHYKQPDKCPFKESRGLILYVNDESGEVSIASRPFSKFERGIFGNEEHINDIDFNWNDFDVYEKVDGSLVKLWYNPIKSCWATSSQNKINNGQFPYDRYFKNGVPFANRNKTYMFELFKGRLIYIASRHNLTGIVDYTPIDGYKHVKKYSNNYVFDILDIIGRDPRTVVNMFMHIIDETGVSFEGFVLIDNYGTGLKIKNELFK
jgi:hypothetical protein